MLIADLERLLDLLAPFSLAESWDNAGLQVGDREAAVRKVLVTLDLSPAVLDEAVRGSFDTVLTHHPLLFKPVRTLTDSNPPERLLRRVIAAGINVFSCHTNLDSAPGGIADAVADALGLEDVKPLQAAPAGWYKFVGFIPPDALDAVTKAVFAAGAGIIGDYRNCAYALEGEGWFTPGTGADPAVGEIGVPERTTEIRWETVVPRRQVTRVVRAYLAAHPYEEPAFDIYPAENVLFRAGLGRVGRSSQPERVGSLARRIGAELGLGSLPWTGDGAREVQRVALVPGSGRSMIEQAVKAADVLVTGDLGYHDAELAGEAGLALILAPHGELEWYALRRWSSVLFERLRSERVEGTLSTTWRSPWSSRMATEMAAAPASETSVGSGDQGWPGGRARLHVDGGSRGNPGPSAIGIVLLDEHGHLVEQRGSVIGTTTNNVAEYRALLTGLEMARERGITDIDVFSDSELLVLQLKGTYQVKSEALKPLHEEALTRLRAFERAAVEHVSREKNGEADRLVNQALDDAARHAKGE